MTPRTRRSKAGRAYRPRQRIEARLDDADGLARQDLGDVRVALGEGLGAGVAHQRQHADAAPGARAQRAAQHAIAAAPRGCRPRRVSFSTSGVRCACAMDSRRRCARIRNWVSGVAWPLPRTSVTFFSGTSSAPVPARRCSMVCCSSSCSSLAPSALTVSVGALRQQQVQVLVEPADGALQLLDGGARHQVAPQALERRADERVGEGEIVVRGGHRPGRHTTASSASSCCSSSRSAHRYTGRLPASSRCCPGLCGLDETLQQRVVDDIDEVRAGHGVGRPHAARPRARTWRCRRCAAAASAAAARRARNARRAGRGRTRCRDSDSCGGTTLTTRDLLTAQRTPLRVAAPEVLARVGESAHRCAGARPKRLMPITSARCRRGRTPLPGPPRGREP